MFNSGQPLDLPGGKWAFDPAAAPPAADKYCTNELRPWREGEDEACLLVSLTFRIDPNRLPDTLHLPSGIVVGALEVTASSPGLLGHDIFSHPADLDCFATEVERAFRKLQDQWRVKKVHLVVGAPASACFRLGQKLQARHHAAMVCYEALPGNGAPFKKPFKSTIATYKSFKQGSKLHYCN